MEYRRRYTLAFLLCALISVLAFMTAGSIKRNNTARKILTSSHDGMTVKIYEIGQPEAPYGETNCRIDLYENGEKTDEQALSIQNDGEGVTEDNFLVEWEDEAVVIETTGTEQQDISVTMNY